MAETKVKKKPKHYVDNKELYKAMVVYRAACKKAEAEGSEAPLIPPYVGECIMKIATHLAYKPNFANYTYREEMVSDGIENCLQYIYNFDPDKGKNPFAYFTQVIYYAFLRRIQKEKKYLYTKHVATELAEINGTTTESQGHDHTNYKNDTGHGEWTQDQMRRFMEDFETSKRKRRKTKVDNKS